MKSFTIQEINDILKGTLVGNTTNTIHGPEQLEKANNNHITFVGNRNMFGFGKPPEHAPPLWMKN